MALDPDDAVHKYKYVSRVMVFELNDVGYIVCINRCFMEKEQLRKKTPQKSCQMEIRQSSKGEQTLTENTAQQAVGKS